jgi:DNA repair protein RecO (recombination protein O)
MFGDGEGNAAAYNLLCHELQLLDAEPTTAAPANLLAFRLKLLLAAGFLPELAECARCGGPPGSGSVRFSSAAGGVICEECGTGDGFSLDQPARAFMSQALSAPLKDAPPVDRPALMQVERAVSGTLEYHAHVRLRSVA